LEFVKCLGDMGSALVCLVHLLSYVWVVDVSAKCAFTEWLVWWGFCALWWQPMCQLLGHGGHVDGLEWLWFEGGRCISIVDFVEGDECWE